MESSLSKKKCVKEKSMQNKKQTLIQKLIHHLKTTIKLFKSTIAPKKSFGIGAPKVRQGYQVKPL